MKTATIIAASVLVAGLFGLGFYYFTIVPMKECMQQHSFFYCETLLNHRH